jgi:HD superfamily phosphodiesterase
MEKIKRFVKEKLNDLDWMHTKQVVNLALGIADKEIVETAAWLHAIGK